jgi:hypothetical protein
MAAGYRALYHNAGDFNTAIGTVALFHNTTGSYNTASGIQALNQNTTGSHNTAVGALALNGNDTGSSNTAIGNSALYSNTTGFSNAADGQDALFSNTTGAVNTATGFEALGSNTEGESNTASGYRALFGNTTGDSNTAYGVLALSANTTGNFNTALGRGAGSAVTTANNVIAIGTAAQNIGNSCYIGQIYSNIQPQVGTDPDLVSITSDGRLGRANVSSRRFKHHIQPIDDASEVLYALTPVSFRYKKEFDATQTIAFGLIAEEVAEVNPDLVGRNPNGEPESVRYEQVNAMLLNEFLKEHCKVEKLEETIASQQKQIQALTAGLQKVTEQIDMKERTTQVVAQNR